MLVWNQRKQRYVKGTVRRGREGARRRATATANVSTGKTLAMEHAIRTNVAALVSVISTAGSKRVGRLNLRLWNFLARKASSHANRYVVLFLSNNELWIYDLLLWYVVMNLWSSVMTWSYESMICCLLSIVVLFLQIISY